MEYLDPKPGQIVVDGTLGLGGHAEVVLERLRPSGKLVGFDKDAEVLVSAKKVLDRFGDSVVIVHEDFRLIHRKLKDLKVQKVQGVLLDLGENINGLIKKEKIRSKRNFSKKVSSKEKTEKKNKK